MTSPIKIAVTGAAGQIGYSLVFRIASGAMFGPEQRIALSLIEIPNALGALVGMFAGLATVLSIFQFTHVAYTWYFLIGAVVTFLVGSLTSRLTLRDQVSGEQTP